MRTPVSELAWSLLISASAFVHGSAEIGKWSVIGKRFDQGVDLILRRIECSSNILQVISANNIIGRSLHPYYPTPRKPDLVHGKTTRVSRHSGEHLDRDYD